MSKLNQIIQKVIKLVYMLHEAWTNPLPERTDVSKCVLYVDGKHVGERKSSNIASANHGRGWPKHVLTMVQQAVGCPKYWKHADVVYARSLTYF